MTPADSFPPDPIIIVPYDTAWPGRFQQLAMDLRAALGDIALRIDHIGSTAVPGLAAKPVIDIQIMVAAFEPFEPIREPLAGLGYRWRADNPDLTKRYFREAPGTPRTHVHVRRHGSWSAQFALLFRDYLRSNQEAATHYAAVKARLASEFREDRQAYTQGKGPIIWALMMEADAWSQGSGWQPGPSDA